MIVPPGLYCFPLSEVKKTGCSEVCELSFRSFLPRPLPRLAGAGRGGLLVRPRWLFLVGLPRGVGLRLLAPFPPDCEAAGDAAVPEKFLVRLPFRLSLFLGIVFERRSPTAAITRAMQFVDQFD